MKKKFVYLSIALSLMLFFSSVSMAATSPLTFTDSETKDGGTLSASQVPYTWTVNLPSNFIKVETAHYDKRTPDSVRKYMGWQGVLKVNGNTLWQFKSWSSQTGGIDYDGSLGKDVADSSGIGAWIDATSFFKAGANSVYFSHFNEGDIGLKIRVTTGASSYCGDGTCDSNESCSSCSTDCGSCKLIDGLSCSNGSECAGGYCVHNKCRNSSTYCGDAYCDSDENCSSCSTDCGVCKKADGISCTSSSECTGGNCIHNICRSSSFYCGDGYCDDGENSTSCANDCTENKKTNGQACTQNGDCISGNCANSFEGSRGICLGSGTFSFDTEINIVAPDYSNSYIKLETNNSQSAFDNFLSSATWEKLYWDEYFCGQTVLRAYDNGSYYYKATNGNQFWSAVRNGETSESYIINALNGLICHSAVSNVATKKYEGLMCSNGSECTGGYCVHNKCRSSSTYCGDAYCDSDELCSSCSADCGVCKKIEGISCINSSECTNGYCVHNICRLSSFYCGDGYCDNGETCSACSSDCGICKKEKGESCEKNDNCKSKNCVKNVCRPQGYTWCGDGVCQYNENCQCKDCKDQGACFLKEEVIKERKRSKTFEEFLIEYFGVYNRIKKLDKKIHVPVLEEDFSPEEMHKALMAQVDEARNAGDEKKAEVLLKSAIAVEKLGLAVYGAEEEMAGTLAKSSWESFKVYLLYKVRLLLSAKLDGAADKLGNKKEVLKMKNKLAAAADIIGADKINAKDIENTLLKAGIQTAQIKGLIAQVNNAYNDAQGNAQKYLDNLENQVRDKYIETYKQMFIFNFKEAISNQVVFFQTGLYHHHMFIGDIPNGDKLYKEYPAQILKIQMQMENYKKIVEEKNNLFNKSQEINNQIIKSTEELGKKIDKLIVVAATIDKGAKMAGKETAFEDVIDKVGDYNESINSAVKLAVQALDIASKFGESLFGTYKEAEIYTTFYSTYSNWCEATLGDCSSYIKIPGTNKYIGKGTITRSLNSVKKSVDSVLKKLQKLAPEPKKANANANKKVLGEAVSRQDNLTAASLWCHNFGVDLKQGIKGGEVSALAMALKNEGILENDSSNIFDQVINKAVFVFQEKYKDEILSPYGLKNPTGYVGKSTRAKLNQLYRCK